MSEIAQAKVCTQTISFSSSESQARVALVDDYMMLADYTDIQ